MKKETDNSRPDPLYLCYPNIIRFAPAALYNTFEEVWLVVQALKEIIDRNEYQQFDRLKEKVTKRWISNII